MSEHRFGRDVFLALAAVAWADGELAAEEADAIVRTAVEEGLDIDEIAAVEDATKRPFSLDAIDLTRMSDADRVFVYAVASWMTRVDGQVFVEELEALETLGEMLGVPPAWREHADGLAREIAEGSEGVAVSRYDLPRLRRTIGERFEQARAAAGASGPSE